MSDWTVQTTRNGVLPRGEVYLSQRRVLSRKRLNFRKKLILSCWFTAVVLGMAALARAEDNRAPLQEYQLKAVCLFNFAKYVKWPDASFSDGSAPVRMCIVEPSPFGNIFKGLANKTAQGRPVSAEVIDPDDLEEAKNCHILFYSGEHVDSERVEKAVKGAGVLTVTENKGKGTINFVMQEGKVRFEIDLAKAKDAGLLINSQMLKLAITVTGQDQQDGGST